MASAVRVAVIGCGSMAGRVHYPSLKSLDDVQVAACCDLDQARLHATADRYEIEGRYTDYRLMVEEVQPAAVYAIGPPQHLYDVWCWCLSQGCNLYIEKPLGLSIHQARSLAWLAEENGCITQVSFQRRACPMVVKLKQIVLERGPIVHAVCRFYKHEPKPFTGARDHMMDDGVHAIDTLRWLCGGEVVQMSSVCKRIGTPDINFISALLEFDSGAVGMLVNSWTSGRRIFDLEIHGHGICVEANPEESAQVYADGDLEGVGYGTRDIAGSDQLFVYGGFRAKHKEFIDAVRTRTHPSSCFADAVKTMEVAEAILAEALLEGR